VAFYFGETRTALDHLAAMWLHADSTGRRRITTASHRIKQILTHAGDSVGVPYPFGQLPTAKRIEVPPLAAVFVYWQTAGQVSVVDYLDIGP
jgi:hypothetical protein